VPSMMTISNCVMEGLCCRRTIFSVSAHYVIDDADGWTLRTDDESLVAHSNTRWL